MDNKDIGRLEDALEQLEEVINELNQLGLTGPKFDIEHAHGKLIDILEGETN